jgi:hypothetical protein
MAIDYKSQGAGAETESNGAALNLVAPAVVAANDILVAHVVHLNATTAPTEPAGWATLFGPSGLGTGTPTGRAWCFGKIAVGDEDGATISFGTNGGTSGRFGRIYSFSGYVSGTITDVIPAASFAENSSETDPAIQAVTTTVAGAKAVALVSQDDDNAHSGLGAVTGGTWVEAVADFISTTVGAQGGCMQIQVGTPTSDPGTISGGTVAGTNDEANTICFEIRPNAPAVTADGAGASTGTSTAIATGASIAAAAASSTGTSTASGIGASIFAAVMSAAGVSTAEAVGEEVAAGTIEAGDGFSEGAASALAEGASLAAAEALSSGASDAQAVGVEVGGTPAPEPEPEPTVPVGSGGAIGRNPWLEQRRRDEAERELEEAELQALMRAAVQQLARDHINRQLGQ